MARKIIIDENKESELIGSILESVFYPRSEQVDEVVEYLDKNFKSKSIPTINTDGYSDLENNFVMSANGVELQTMKPKELLRLLDDKFHHRIKDDKARKAFLKQVITDWHNGKIKNGLLTVNKIDY